MSRDSGGGDRRGGARGGRGGGHHYLHPSRGGGGGGGHRRSFGSYRDHREHYHRDHADHREPRFSPRGGHRRPPRPSSVPPLSSPPPLPVRGGRERGRDRQWSRGWDSASVANRRQAPAIGGGGTSSPLSIPRPYSPDFAPAASRDRDQRAPRYRDPPSGGRFFDNLHPSDERGSHPRNGPRGGRGDLPAPQHRRLPRVRPRSAPGSRNRSNAADSSHSHSGGVPSSGPAGRYSQRGDYNAGRNSRQLDSNYNSSSRNSRQLDDTGRSPSSSSRSSGSGSSLRGGRPNASVASPMPQAASPSASASPRSPSLRERFSGDVAESSAASNLRPPFHGGGGGSGLIGSPHTRPSLALPGSRSLTPTPVVPAGGYPRVRRTSAPFTSPSHLSSSSRRTLTSSGAAAGATTAAAAGTSQLRTSLSFDSSNAARRPPPHPPTPTLPLRRLPDEDIKAKPKSSPTPAKTPSSKSTGGDSERGSSSVSRVEKDAARDSVSRSEPSAKIAESPPLSGGETVEKISKRDQKDRGKARRSPSSGVPIKTSTIKKVAKVNASPTSGVTAKHIAEPSPRGEIVTKKASSHTGGDTDSRSKPAATRSQRSAGRSSESSKTSPSPSSKAARRVRDPRPASEARDPKKTSPPSAAADRAPRDLSSRPPKPDASSTKTGRDVASSASVALSKPSRIASEESDTRKGESTEKHEASIAAKSIASMAASDVRDPQPTSEARDPNKSSSSAAADRASLARSSRPPKSDASSTKTGRDIASSASGALNKPSRIASEESDTRKGESTEKREASIAPKSTAVLAGARDSGVATLPPKGGAESRGPAKTLAATKDDTPSSQKSPLETPRVLLKSHAPCPSPTKPSTSSSSTMSAKPQNSTKTWFPHGYFASTEQEQDIKAPGADGRSTPNVVFKPSGTPSKQRPNSDSEPLKKALELAKKSSEVQEQSASSLVSKSSRAPASTRTSQPAGATEKLSTAKDKSVKSTQKELTGAKSSLSEDVASTKTLHPKRAKSRARRSSTPVLSSSSLLEDRIRTMMYSPDHAEAKRAHVFGNPHVGRARTRKAQSKASLSPTPPMPKPAPKRKRRRASLPCTHVPGSLIPLSMLPVDPLPALKVSTSGASLGAVRPKKTDPTPKKAAASVSTSSATAKKSGVIPKKRKFAPKGTIIGKTKPHASATSVAAAATQRSATKPPLAASTAHSASRARIVGKTRKPPGETAGATTATAIPRKTTIIGKTKESLLPLSRKRTSKSKSKSPVRKPKEHVPQRSARKSRDATEQRLSDASGKPAPAIAKRKGYDRSKELKVVLVTPRRIVLRQITPTPSILSQCPLKLEPIPDNPKPSRPPLRLPPRPRSKSKKSNSRLDEPTISASSPTSSNSVHSDNPSKKRRRLSPFRRKNTNHSKSPSPTPPLSRASTPPRSASENSSTASARLGGAPRKSASRRASLSSAATTTPKAKSKSAKASTATTTTSPLDLKTLQPRERDRSPSPPPARTPGMKKRNREVADDDEDAGGVSAVTEDGNTKKRARVESTSETPARVRARAHRPDRAQPKTAAAASAALALAKKPPNASDTEEMPRRKANASSRSNASDGSSPQAAGEAAAEAPLTSPNSSISGGGKNSRSGRNSSNSGTKSKGKGGRRSANAASGGKGADSSAVPVARRRGGRRRRRESVDSMLSQASSLPSDYTDVDEDDDEGDTSSSSSAAGGGGGAFSSGGDSDSDGGEESDSDESLSEGDDEDGESDSDGGKRRKRSRRKRPREKQKRTRRGRSRRARDGRLLEDGSDPHDLPGTTATSNTGSSPSEHDYLRGIIPSMAPASRSRSRSAGSSGPEGTSRSTRMVDSDDDSASRGKRTRSSRNSSRSLSSRPRRKRVRAEQSTTSSRSSSSKARRRKSPHTRKGRGSPARKKRKRDASSAASGNEMSSGSDSDSDESDSGDESTDSDESDSDDSSGRSDSNCDSDSSPRESYFGESDSDDSDARLRLALLDSSRKVVPRNCRRRRGGRAGAGDFLSCLDSPAFRPAPRAGGVPYTDMGPADREKDVDGIPFPEYWTKPARGSTYLYEIKERVLCLRNRYPTEAKIINRRCIRPDMEPEYRVHYQNTSSRNDDWVTRYAIKGLIELMSSPYDDPMVIHYQMLSDRPRAKAYSDAILNNPQLFKGKTVVDVGGGMGILSLKCAKAGAKHVYLIEPARVIHFAKRIIKQNGYDHIISCHYGDVARIDLPERVDILVSEWMGYALVYENGLEHIMVARAKYLKPDGIMFPDYARLYICGIEDNESKAEFWEDVEGFDMSYCKALATKTPIIGLNHGIRVTQSAPILELDLATCRYEDSFVDSDFVLHLLPNKKVNRVNGFVLWFDVQFRSCKPVVTLSTGKDDPDTHWMQVHLYFDRPHPLPKPGSALIGHLTLASSEYNPNVDFIVKLDVTIETEDPTPSRDGKKKSRYVTKRQEYMMTF